MREHLFTRGAAFHLLHLVRLFSFAWLSCFIEGLSNFSPKSTQQLHQASLPASGEAYVHVSFCEPGVRDVSEANGPI